jgi:hypothetical protein
VTAGPSADRPWTIPELGPSLGGLVDPARPGKGPLGLAFDDVRLELVTAVFDLAGASRSFAAAGDRAGAATSLGRVAWLGAWERAVEASAARIARAANDGLRSAAAEARYPARRLQRLMLTDQDTRAIGARIGSGGAPFVAALDGLEQAVHGVVGAASRSAEAIIAWREALGGTARRLESAWLALERSARAEQERWSAEIARVRAWHRPGWPVWLVTAVVMAAALYVGLVLGGYLPVPPALEGIAAFWWTHL